ncbi:MAG: 30S ribosomal protein S5 [Candidatus Doudnabacteria bacterium RIFCSPLOWO2_02_FULL_42_9]|uniref:Small ribosomal subunit protein uS5 n=1 Tax=Candidatus Doudnabacteria bacterium RIFCSPHIGHO2_01_FULL_41_86 TaxID=1817821 RepID=A0A1F5N9W2_9BACT|nr:MAG: 30S ribosomal protein S5 [Candidatus Doudnabacteria bacterium RIFCSPHIGHO2_01_FULL_41_86]OGE75024.1 MAG: 30S ribosomal protein S5 [Candidatus Doudnabacteria bacterium RIFCSPHIGHO2_01_43_10]OGE85269.1 MAG: 30S ribosomal protein S5 [Candidatus Doudnabacteria bacterium RIFCSPHIGHO2_12_FULL_42_22]OGE86807.1 MAG: 30S ribosomal protein S5 [Candidatus Doudnabacteria bacterium RIFCSPHIGHO2_02_FULL_42_25]OGE92406.1 MAG: 30S ribosomal protein S5 [Candidatus Doudnabacteria bacterium RIFCSPLOWO2_01
MKQQRRGGRGGGDQAKREFDQKIVEIKRVTRVTGGGKRMRFRALVVIGDRKGRVGMGIRKGPDVSEAVNKAVNSAKKNMITVKIVNDTIPHEIKLKYKSAVVFLKPAMPGTGVIAGGAIRSVLDLVGIKNVLSKMIGSSNKVNNVMATYLALNKLRSKEEYAQIK